MERKQTYFREAFPVTPTGMLLVSEPDLIEALRRRGEKEAKPFKPGGEERPRRKGHP